MIPSRQSPTGPLSQVVLKRPWCGNGFTLVEMIVVCALIGIMLSLAVPSMRNTLFTDPLKSTGRKIIGMVSGVRELAVRDQHSYLLHVSEAENRLWYEKEVDKDQNVEAGLLDVDELLIPATVKIADLRIGDESSLLKDSAVIWISKQGYMRRTVIRLQSDDGSTLTLQFSPFLDAVEVSDDLARR